MSNKNYLQDLFINEAKPALKRHSGSGGGGGSSRLVECESLPTENVDEDKIYLAEWTETKEVPPEYTAAVSMGDGSAPVEMSFDELIDNECPVVDSLDDIPFNDREILNAADGKMYYISDGNAIEYFEYIEVPGEQLGYVNSPDELDPNVMQLGTIKHGGLVNIFHKDLGTYSNNLTIHSYSNGKWRQHGFAKSIIGLNTPPTCFNSNQYVRTYEGVIGYSDTSDVVNMNYMFDLCYALTTVPLFDTSKVTSMDSMFSQCEKLTTVPLFDTSRVISMHRMFHYCHALTTVPLFDTSRVNDMHSMFYACYALTTVPSFDIRNVTSGMYMLSYCTNLTECWLRNIKTSLQVGSGTSYGHLLTVDSLVHLIYELRDTGSSLTLTVGSANLEKLASVYVKTVEITDEMRAEDDLVDEKLPFVVCESTDEGAMLIKDYVNFKNWNLA